MEAPLKHGLVEKKDIAQHLASAMKSVSLDSSLSRRYPHQFSGGQAQRIGIARALGVNPEFIVCDEAVAALDVSIQAQILNLFMKLRQELGLTYLFISHDLGIVQHLSDRVMIMYLGRIVESGTTEKIYDSPNHPYTVALLRSRTSLNARQKTFRPVKGEIPSCLNPPSGCHFHPRCPKVMKRCLLERPTLKEVEPDRLVACHLFKKK